MTVTPTLDPTLAPFTPPDPGAGPEHRPAAVQPPLGPAGAARPGWSTPARVGVFTTAAVLYVWNLSHNAMANSFYTAAVKSGTESWKAFFFGSIDKANFITVDKPPAALWLQELSARAFGFSSWSVLLPEALAGVASVMVLYHLVRRWVGEKAAVMASLAFALTPAATLMFRYNNPDALLTLLLLLGAWALWSALQSARTSRLVLAGGLIGLAFLTKTLEAFIVLPAFALVYAWCGPPRLRRRVGQLAWFGLATLVASGWWVAIVELWPASSRPYIGGSTDNSELNLIFGYNGFSRIFGTSAPGGGGGTGGPSFAGSPGWLRMFNDLLGGEISWLLPLAAAGLVAGLWLTRRHPRTDRLRAGYLLWGAWTAAFLVVFSDAKGIFHPYYTVVMAPAVGALVGGGLLAMWRLGRQSRRWAPVLPLSVLGSAIWAAMLLGRSPGYDTWLIPTVLAGGALAALGLAVLTFRPNLRPGALGLVAGLVAGATLLAGPAAWSVTTARTAYSGGGITAGPAGGGLGAGGAGGGPAGAPGGTRALGTGSRPTGAPAGDLPGGGFPGSGFSGGAAGPGRGAPTFGRASSSGFPGGGVGRGGGAGGADGSVSTGLIRYLEAHQGGATFLLAVAGSETAAPYIIDTGRAVMAIGGFSGTDPAPTLTEFEHLVAEGAVHYVLVSGQGGGGAGPGGGGSGTSSAIFSWVETHGTAVSASAYGGASSGGTLYRVGATS